MDAQAGEIEIRPGDDRRHAGTAVAAGDLHAVDISFQRRRRYCADRLLDFGGRDVLAFPAEGVADRGRRNRNSRRRPCASGRRCGTRRRPWRTRRAGFSCWSRPPSHSLRSGRRALDGSLRILPITSPGSSAVAFDAEAVGARAPAAAARRRSAPPWWESGCARNQGTRPTAPCLAVEIEQRHVALGRAVELEDLRECGIGS